MVALTLKQLYIIVYSILGSVVLVVISWILWKRYRNLYIETWYRNKFIRAVIIRRNNQLVVTSNVIQDNKFNWNKKTYVVDPKAVKYKKHIPYGFYFESNPNPIGFKEKDIDLDSTTLKQMLETKVLRDLFHDPKEFNWLLGLGIANLLATVIVGLAVFDVFK